jgi:hypothetical protein
VSNLVNVIPTVQTSSVPSQSEPRDPGVLDMGPPVVVGPLIAAAVFGAATFSAAAAQQAAGVALAVVLFVGWPVIFWMLDNGRYGPIPRTVAGLVCGAAPFVAAIVSGTIGHYARSNDLSHVRWALGYGAPVPYYGVIIWPKFAWLAVLGMLSGVLTMWLSSALATARRRRASGPSTA